MSFELVFETMTTAVMAAALTLYLHGTVQYRETAFGAALWMLSAVLGIGVALSFLDAVYVTADVRLWTSVVLVGGAAAFSVVGATPRRHDDRTS